MEKLACTHKDKKTKVLRQRSGTKARLYITGLSVQSLATLQAWWVVSAHFESSNLGLIKSDLQNARTA